MRFPLSALVLVSLSLSAHASVIITGGDGHSWATNADPILPAQGSPQQVQTASNTLQSTVSSNFNGSVNTTTYDMAVAGSLGHAMISTNLAMPAVPGTYSGGENQGIVYFTVTDAPVNYYLSGDFQIQGSTNIVWTVGLRSGKKSVLYEEFQSSNSTMDEYFVLGQEGGDVYHQVGGNLNGVLDVGTYMFSYSYGGMSTLGGTATADAYVRIDFGAPPSAPTPAAVPEPSTWACMGLGLLGLALARRRKA